MPILQSKASVAKVQAAPASRRLVLSAIVVPLVAVGSAKAKDFTQAQAEKEARRKKLRDAAQEEKETGRDVGAVFDSPEYSISEEARTPNFRARTTEGTREERSSKTK